MDNEEDYIELHRLLAKCKWNMAKDQIKFPLSPYYTRKIEQIEKFIVDIPIIIKGDG